MFTPHKIVLSFKEVALIMAITLGLVWFTSTVVRATAITIEVVQDVADGPDDCFTPQD
jgi:hypothetical protein